MALNYAALKAHIATIFSKFATTGQKINAADEKDVLDKIVDHLTNDGGWDPATMMTQVAALTANYPNRFQSLYTDIYVSEAGNDNNPGTSALPLRTLARAAEIVNWKFRAVTVFVVGGSFTHNSHADFNVENLELRLYNPSNNTPTTFTIGKQTLNAAFNLEGLYRISNRYGNLRVHCNWHTGQPRGNIILSALATPLTGADMWLLSRSRSAFQAGDIFCQYPSNVQVMTGNITLGDNTYFASGNLGDNNYNNDRVFFWELDSTWTIGSGAAKRSPNTIREVVNPRNYTPTTSTDAEMSLGITVDNNFLYVKTPSGTIKKIALSTF